MNFIFIMLGIIIFIISCLVSVKADRELENETLRFITSMGCFIGWLIGPCMFVSGLVNLLKQLGG